MYTNFFGFSQKPFNLTPDPQFFYLGANQKKALAHLLYGITNRKGFIALTGEVGSGKTTLCRLLLKELDADVSVALILNSMVDQVTLLKQINRDFGIPFESNIPDVLIGALYDFLISEKKEGRNVVFIVDECQNLKFEVLEQIRMLSNLETEKDKLLQILLIGQPEFLEMLHSYELRQLNSRITVRAHIAALSREEIEAYIFHRLKVAGNESAVRFTPGALKKIESHSGGIPRMVNVICDYALLSAYVDSSRIISGRMVSRAIQDIAIEKQQKSITKSQGGGTTRLVFSRVAVFTGLVLAVFLLREPLQAALADISALLRGFPQPPFPAGGVSGHVPGDRPAFVPFEGVAETDPETSPATRVPGESEPPLTTTVNRPSPQDSPENPEVEPSLLSPAEAVAPREVPLPIPPPAIPELVSQEVPIAESPVVKPAAMPASRLTPSSVDPFFERLNVREKGLWLLLANWGLVIQQERRDDSGRVLTLEDQLERFRYALYPTWADFDLLTKINLPCAVRVTTPYGEAYWVIDAVRGDRVRFRTAPEQRVVWDRKTFESAWQGDALILAELGDNTFPEDIVFFRGMEHADVLRMRHALENLGYTTGDGGHLFDLDMERSVKNFQQDFGLTPDGIVGVEAKLALYSLNSRNIPRMMVRE